MKNIVLLAFLTLMPFSKAFSQKTITCADNTCSANFSAQQVLEKAHWTAMEVGPNSENITVSVPTNTSPRSIRLSVENGGVPRNLLLNLSSTKATANAGNAMIIGDLFNNLEIKLDGYSGKKGLDASQICAANIKSGKYELAAKNFFEQRREADPSLNPNRCDRIDLTYLQTYGFSCDDPTYTQLEGTNPLVEVNRIRSKARCSGILVQDICLKIKRVVTCRWRGYDVVCSKYGCSNVANNNVQLRYHYSFEEELYNKETAAMGATNFCTNYIGRPAGNFTLESITSQRTSPGVDALQNPLPGSIWEMYKTEAYGTCNVNWARVRTESVQKVAYDETGTDCNRNDIAIPEDPNKIIPWSYVGMAQEPEFGTEVLQCAIGECPVNSTLSDLQRTLDVIVPENGDSGTQQGNGVALVYDANLVSATAIIGQAGAAGMADLDSPESTKFCGKIRDAMSDGLNSEFARNPSVSFRRYNWKALRTNGGGNNGVQPPGSTNSVEVYKKIDPSVRFLLTKELL